MLKKNLRILVLFLFIFVIGICLSVSANQLQKNNLSTEDVYINEEITTPVSRIATPKLNFKSKNIEKKVQDYIIENVGLVPNYQIIFSFMIFDDKTLVSLDVSALPLVDNGKPYPTTYFYGFLCERENLSRDRLEKHFWKGSTPVKETIDARTVDIGPTLVLLYATLRNLGNEYYTDIPEYLQNKPYYYVSGSIYNNDMYVSVEREKG